MLLSLYIKLINQSSFLFHKDHFITLNPNSYDTYFILGRFYYTKKEYILAKEMFETALKKDVPSQSLKKEIENFLILCSNKK